VAIPAAIRAAIRAVIRTAIHAAIHAAIRFAQVPEFKDFFKPKHHYVAHAPLDILKLGPMRGFWCWSFEGFHQIMKRIAADSNFKGNVCKRIVEVWRFQFGLRYYRK
jgi:hypothetical protein